MVKVVPCPGVLATVMVPPCLLMMPETTARPSPVLIDGLLQQSFALLVQHQSCLKLLQSTLLHRHVFHLQAQSHLPPQIVFRPFDGLDETHTLVCPQKQDADRQAWWHRRTPIAPTIQNLEVFIPE